MVSLLMQLLKSQAVLPVTHESTLLVLTAGTGTLLRLYDVKVRSLQLKKKFAHYQFSKKYIHIYTCSCDRCIQVSTKKIIYIPHRKSLICFVLTSNWCLRPVKIDPRTQDAHKANLQHNKQLKVKPHSVDRLSPFTSPRRRPTFRPHTC